MISADMQNVTNEQPKIEADTLQKLDVSKITKSSYFKQSEPRSKVGIKAFGRLVWVEPDYKVGDDVLRIPIKNGRGQRVDAIIGLTETKANLGGVRRWFECPGCLRNVRTLYLAPPPPDENYGCQRCLNLTYESRNRSKGALIQAITKLIELQEMEHSIRRISYKGKPTRHMRRLQKMQEKFNDAGACFIQRQNDNSK